MGRFALLIVLLLLLPADRSFSQEQGENNYEEAVAYAAEGKFEEGIEKLRKIREEGPTNSSIDLTITLMEKAIDRQIKRETAHHLFKGIQYYIKGTQDSAITEFNRAIQSEPGNVVYYNYRGSAHARKGMYENALSDFNRALDINDRYGDGYISRGIVYSKKGDYDRAISDYNRALEIDRGSADAYFNRGVAHAKKGQHVLAILDYDRAIEINSEYASALINRGFIYLVHLENKEKACADWKRACELEICNNYRLAKEEGHCE